LIEEEEEEWLEVVEVGQDWVEGRKIVVFVFGEYTATSQV